jgi:DNA mismatch endonuclease, patch repair protein
MSKAPPASSPAVRRVMQANRGRDTGPELRLRHALRLVGARGYRVDRQPLPGLRRRADVVFTAARVAVYADGCFWHGCPVCGIRPTMANPEYWAAKIEANRARDAGTDLAMAAAGWVTLRFWEHDLRAAERLADAAVRIVRIVRSRIT